MKGFSDLMADVVLEDICCYCGGCGAFCENIDYKNENPVAKDCHDCGMCYNVCPRTELRLDDLELTFFNAKREDDLLGYYRKILCAKSLDEKIRGVCQDGGITSALLCHLLEKGIVDACVVAKSENWIPKPFIARSVEDVLSSAGSKYTQCPSVLALGKALDEGLRVAFVGLPCHIQAVRKLQIFDYSFNGEIVVTIGLFCMETFSTGKFFRYLDELGIRREDVKKFDIKKGKFIIEANERVEIPIKDMKHLIRKACRVCCDFSAELSDISVGSVGSPMGWNTVMIRSEIGEKLFDDFVKDCDVETKEITEKGLNAVRKLAEMKKKENAENLKKIAKVVRVLNLTLDSSRVVV
jgi:coenzyme F420 hydrogenase subunit beta